MEISPIFRLELLIVLIWISPSLSLVKCPKGIRSYSVYPDEVNDPSYYYDCSKTRIAVLKRCKVGEFYDREKSKCSVFPGWAQGRSISRKSGTGLGSRQGQGNVNAANQGNNKAKPPSLAAITPAEMNKFLTTRAISEHLRVPALGRPIRLGAMYYGDEDRIAYDENLWKDSTLKNNASVAETASSNFKIQETNDILQKMNLFNIEGGVKLSLADGMISVSLQLNKSNYLA